MSTSASQSPLGTQQDPIELLRTIAPALQNGHKETLKQAAELVKKLQAERDELRQALSAKPLPEATASVNFKMVHTITQAEGLFTLRGHTDAELQERLQRRISSLVDSGWIAFDAYVDQRRAEREANAPPPVAMLPANGGPPLCPDGHGPMKASTKAAGEWFCSHVVGTHPQTGKKLYCTHKVKG